MNSKQFNAIKARYEAAKHKHDHDYFHDDCGMCQSEKQRYKKSDLPTCLDEIERLEGLITAALSHLKHRGWYSEARRILEQSLEK